MFVFVVVFKDKQVKVKSVSLEKFKIILPLTTVYIIISRNRTIFCLYISYFYSIYHVGTACNYSSPQVFIFSYFVESFDMLISVFKRNLALWNIKNNLAAIIYELSSAWNMFHLVFIIIGEMSLSFLNNFTYRFARLHDGVKGSTYTCIVVPFKLLCYIIYNTLFIHISIIA